MPSNKTMRYHAELVDKMAAILDVDLEEAVMRGRLAPDALPDMVLRCTGCSSPDRCETWLGRNRPGPEMPGPSSGPFYCRNAEVFDDLKRF